MELIFQDMFLEQMYLIKILGEWDVSNGTDFHYVY